MDLTKVLGEGLGVGFGSGIAGGIIQGVADFLAPHYSEKALKEANVQAQGIVNKGYDEAGNYIGEGYQRGQQYLETGGKQAREAVEGGYQQGRLVQQPYQEAGMTGMKNLNQILGEDFQFDYQQDPGYQARLKEGQGAIQSSAAARGGVLSSATLKALSRFNQEFASNEYGKAYNRAYGEYGDKANISQNMARMGQQAAGNVSSSYASQGQQMGNIYGQEGQNLAQMAGTYGRDRANIATGRASELGNLAIQKGNIAAGKAQAYGGAGSRVGQNLTNLGAMYMGYGANPTPQSPYGADYDNMLNAYNKAIR